ncbi:uncharacterized protein [Gossypium hirsutum]|uniref:Uncharacterized protein n=1 Tax=Gossypium hirsutum TaxID=3635 RepID=A0A1U8JK60_GOSHI|nr:uncharacterized protein LOC107907882 [Gossypium hirsutum]
MPKYAKFFKDVMSHRKKIGKGKQIIFNEEYSMVVSRKVPPKFTDPSSFTIPIEIGRVSFRKALCDLKASINLMPLSIYRRLGLGELQENIVTLQLVGRSLVHPKGFLEDVLMRDMQFIFLVDFIMLDFEKDLKISIVLERPFLATSKATIDVGMGELTIDIEGETKIFKCVKPKPKSYEVLPIQGNESQSCRCSCAMQENPKVNEDKKDITILRRP